MPGRLHKRLKLAHGLTRLAVKHDGADLNRLHLLGRDRAVVRAGSFNINNQVKRCRHFFREQKGVRALSMRLDAIIQFPSA